MFQLQQNVSTMQGRLSIKIYAHPTKMKGNRSQLYCRLIYDRQKAEFATQYYVEAKDWHPENQRLKKDDTINSELAEMESDLRKIKQRLSYDDKFISAKTIKDVYIGKTTVETYLLNKYDEYIDYVTRSTSISPGTVKAYKKTYHHIQNFVRTEFGRDITVKQVNLDFIERFDQYLCQQPGQKAVTLMINTINKHHSKFRTYILYLFRHELIHHNPYTKFKLTYEESDRTFLTQEELEKFSNYPLGGNESLERIRDIFLFSVYTGKRYGDAHKMKMSDLILQNGAYYFYHKEEKSRNLTMIPVLPPAMAIIEKYALTVDRSKGFVLPQKTNQKVNTYLKIIAELVGIVDKNVTHHVARHTCATTVLLENGVGMDVVQEWLNHKNIRETMIYAKMTSRVVNEAVSVQKLFEKYQIRPSTSI